MEHYTGEKLPDKCTRETLLGAMVKNVIQTIADYEAAGFSLTKAIARTKKDSCAGPAVWEKVLRAKLIEADKNRMVLNPEKIVFILDNGFTAPATLYSAALRNLVVSGMGYAEWPSHQ